MASLRFSDWRQIDNGDGTWRVANSKGNVLGHVLRRDLGGSRTAWFSRPSSKDDVELGPFDDVAHAHRALFAAIDDAPDAS